jgi:hypothetical protein
MAIQWGLVGIVLLLAMWGSHLWWFRDGFGAEGKLLAWIGLLAVVQNIASSLLNSHLLDFYPGWIYLLAVAIAGGQLARYKNPRVAGASTRGKDEMALPADFNGQRA